MDQVRVIVRLLWRERFWVLSVVGVLVAVVCWQVSSKDLDQQFSNRKSAIDSSFTTMTALTQQAVHPNDDVNQGDKAQLREQRNIVLKVWKELYDRQREEVLYWPKESLKATFIEEIEKLEFGEQFPVRAAGDMRSHYRNYIASRFKGLLKIVKALDLTGKRGRSNFDRGQSGNGHGNGGGSQVPAALGNAEEQEQDYLVQWIDQNELRDKLQFKSNPTSMQIWVTQEDLWVYETLLSVIANTNQERGATRPDNTAVRVIVALEVGEDATANQETASILMLSDRAGRRGRGGRRDGANGDEEANDAAVLAYRYLDSEGQPYKGKPEDPEFRRLPVRMRLVMDQRWIPQLLIECANASLPIEVKQLRVNPDQSGAGFGSDTNRSGVRATRVKGVELLAADANLADVEIRGVVYVYNKPDKTVLEVPGLDEDQFADATTGGLQR